MTHTVLINRQKCIFDEIPDNFVLSVSIVKPYNYKRLTFMSGPHKNKIYARVLLNAPDHLCVDHINGNTLDNRVENLRLVTHQQNAQNAVAAKSKKSGLPKGVYKRNWGYTSKITDHLGMVRNLGMFTTVERAEEAYKKKAKEYHGEHASHISRGA